MTSPCERCPRVSNFRTCCSNAALIGLRNGHCCCLAMAATGERIGLGKGRLQGMSALITEAGGSLGSTVAAAFTHEGAIVTPLDADVRDIAQLAPLIDRLAQSAGEFDAVVINTAFEWQRDIDRDDDVTELERAFRTSIEAAFQFAQAVARLVREGGSITLTAPMRHAHPAEPVRALAANSHAIVNLTSSLAQALAPRRIRVNSVVPGPVLTSQTLARLPRETLAPFGSETLRGVPARGASSSTDPGCLPGPRAHAP